VLHVFHQSPEQLALLRLPSRPAVHRPLERLMEVHDGIAHLWIGEGAPRQGFLAIDRVAETEALLLAASRPSR
jgi:hypothetical protein